MINIYTELLEQIITEMKSALLGGNTGVIDSDYRQWLDFLRQVHPESELLKNNDAQQVLPVQNARAVSALRIQSDDGLKEYSNLREIMKLAAVHKHPTWYIQPHFAGSIAEFIYENEQLQNALGINGVPKVIERFSGAVYGVWLDEQTFIACDTDNKTNFIQKMEFLKNAGFTSPDFAEFPTDKLLTVSVSKLETSLMNFISSAQKSWAKVDGAVIVSDTPLFNESGGEDSHRIIFKPNILLTL